MNRIISFNIMPIITALFLGACLQATVEEKLLEYIPVAQDIQSRSFSCNNTDMLIVIIYGGTLQASLNPAHFQLTRDNAPVPLTMPVRADDNCVLFSFAPPLENGEGYRLTVKPAAVISGNYAKTVIIQTVSGKEWNAVTTTGFLTTLIRSLTYANGKFIAVGDSGKMAYSVDQGNTWISVPGGESPSGSRFNDTVCGIAGSGSGYYAVGKGARMSFSNDGQNWTGHRLYIPDGPYGESLFVYNDGSKDIYPDINCIAYGKGRFVAVGGSGRTVFRWDLDVWRRADFIQDPTTPNTVVWGDTGGSGRFILGCDGGLLYWSDISGRESGDNKWTLVGDDSVFGDHAIRGSAYGNGMFVAGGDGGKLARSIDGKTWAAADNSPFGTSGVLGIAFGSGVFIAVGHDGKIAESADGVSWTLISGHGFNANEQISGIAADGRGRFVAAGNDYDSGQSKIVSWYQKPPAVEIPVLPDLSWGTAEIGGGKDIRGTAWNGALYVAVGDGIIAFSADGASWTENTAEKTKWDTGGDHVSFRDIVWGGGRFVAVGYWANKTGDMGAVAVSDADGQNWTLYTAPVLTASLPNGSSLIVDPKVYGISYANNRYIAVGGRGWSAWSTDGSTWNPVWIESFSQYGMPENNEDATAVVSDGVRFVVGGTKGKLAYSVNGGNGWEWIANALLDSEYNDILALGYGNGKFIAAGSQGKMKAADVSRITDGSGWQTVQSGFYSGINALAWGTGYYLAAGNGRIALSADGGEWAVVSPAGWSASDPMYSAFFGDRFIIGGRGKIIYSE